MDKLLISVPTNNELYVTHAEFQECFIKIWARFDFNQENNFKMSAQNYKNYTKVINIFFL